MSSHPVGDLVLVVGLIVAIGFEWLFESPISWFGWLLGDIVIERENARVYFSITTCVLRSQLPSGIAWLVRNFSR